MISTMNPNKTIVLRKDGHWFIINSKDGNPRDIILTLLEYSENKRYSIGKEDVSTLCEKLGYSLEIHENIDLAS